MTDRVDKVPGRVPGLSRLSWDWDDIISRYGTVLALIVIFVAFWILESRFVSGRNLLNILRQISTLSVVAGGLTVCVAAGEFDLSVGTVASLSGILVAGMMVRQQQGVGVALLVALAAGIAFGVAFGFIVTVFRVPSLIATIGGASIALGANFAYAGGDSIYGQMPPAFQFIGQGFVGGIPFTVILALAVLAVLYFFLNRSRAGRYIIATGANPKAARLSGISVNRYRFLGLVISAFFAALAGIMLTSYLGSARHSTCRTSCGVAHSFSRCCWLSGAKKSASSKGTDPRRTLRSLRSCSLGFARLPWFLSQRSPRTQKIMRKSPRSLRSQR